MQHTNPLQLIDSKGMIMNPTKLMIPAVLLLSSVNVVRAYENPEYEEGLEALASFLPLQGFAMVNDGPNDPMRVSGECSISLSDDNKRLYFDNEVINLEKARFKKSGSSWTIQEDGHYDSKVYVTFWIAKIKGEEFVQFNYNNRFKSFKTCRKYF